MDAVVRGLIDKDFIEKRKSGACVFCALCARVCPTGALEVRTAGKAEKDDSYLSVALKPTVVNESCVHCGLCVEVCPQACIEMKDRHLAEDGSLKLGGQTLIDLNRCVHCGWCASVCPVGAISFEKPFAGVFSRDDNVCQVCKTCVHTCPANALFNREWKAGEIGREGYTPQGCLHLLRCLRPVLPGESHNRSQDCHYAGDEGQKGLREEARHFLLPGPL